MGVPLVEAVLPPWTLPIPFLLAKPGLVKKPWQLWNFACQPEGALGGARSKTCLGALSRLLPGQGSGGVLPQLPASLRGLNGAQVHLDANGERLPGYKASQ